METKLVPVADAHPGCEDPLPPALGPEPGPEPDESVGIPLVFRAAVCIALIVVALICAFMVAPSWSTTDHYAAQIQTLDEKKNNVLGLVTSTTLASTAISAIPGDTATPLAEKLADLSSDLLIVLAVIYLEKFLITTLSYISLTWLLPLAFGLYGLLTLSYGTRYVPSLRSAARRIAWIALVFGIMLVAVIPTSVWISDRIDQTYEESLLLTVNDSDMVTSTDASSANDSLSDQGANSDASADSTANGGAAESDANVIDQIVNFFTDTAENVSQAVSEGVQSLSDDAISTITQLIDTIAVMIVTSCLIPLLVLVVFFWLAKTVAGIDLGPVSGVFDRAHGIGRKASRTVHDATTSPRV